MDLQNLRGNKLAGSPLAWSGFLSLRLGCGTALALAFALLFTLPAAAQRERQALNITGYVIDAEIDTTAHHLTARPPSASPRRPTSTWSRSASIPRSRSPRSPTTPARCSMASAPPTAPFASPRLSPFTAGQTCIWTFVYDGTITGNEDGPVEGLKLAAIQEPISYLLYAARWFPTTGYHDRSLHRRDAHPRPAGHARHRQRQPRRVPSRSSSADGKPGDQYDFNWTKPGFPGTVIAGRFVEPVSVGAGNVKVYLTVSHQASGNQLAQTADKEYDFFTDSFGEPSPSASTSSNCPTTRCPPSTLPSSPPSWAPASATSPASASSPTPSPTSGGAAKSRPARSTTPGSPTACRATAS